ncbi:MAG: dioxygenase [Pirellulales bacterium]|nr:dioxygenase [Pirellulales bacterium]
MITKQFHQGVGHSVVELHDARHVCVAALPRAGRTLAEQTRDALGALGELMDEHGTRGSTIRQAVFVADARQIEVCRRLIETFYGDAMPATTYVPQGPCPGKLVAIEAHGIAQGRRPVRIERHSPQLVVTRHEGVAWCHCANVVPDPINGSLHAGALNAFGHMARLLENAGFRYSQVIRTWLYLDDIVGADATRPRYQEFNRARADFYDAVPFPRSHANGTKTQGRFYPASTGIGARGNGVTMSCIALASRRDDLRVVPLENPIQTAAFDYDVRYGPQSPSFSRAVAVVADGTATLFVSGTASITGTESRHAGDVGRQTHQTLDNIASLIHPANLARHGVEGCGATLADLAHLRVYVKHPADYETVRAICHDRLGPLPAVYAVADICRPELLVEIEAVAFAVRAASKTAR